MARTTTLPDHRCGSTRSPDIGRRSSLAVVAVAIVVAGIAGWLGGWWSGGTTFADGGPLTSGEAYGWDCSPHEHTGQSTAAQYPLQNAGNQALTIEAVRLLNPRAFKLEAAFLVPISGTYLMGDTPSFPPPPETRSIPGVHWNRRIHIVTGTVIPAHSMTYNVALQLSQAASLARFDGVEIDYQTAAGDSYRWQEHVGFKYATKC